MRTGRGVGADWIVVKLTRSDKRQHASSPRWRTLTQGGSREGTWDTGSARMPNRVVNGDYAVGDR